MEGDFKTRLKTDKLKKFAKNRCNYVRRTLLRAQTSIK